jgi:aminopeptidase N
VNKTIYLKNYKEPAFEIPTIDLCFKIHDTYTLVIAKMHIIKNPQNIQDDLLLDGNNLETLKIKLNEKELTSKEFFFNDKILSIKNVPHDFTLTTYVKIYPDKNTQLEGLYRSSQNLCTQCEAEGFRSITWFIDRPDILSKFNTTIIAEHQKYPTLLSNGNLIKSIVDNDKKEVVFDDPYPKPCYLFALVAGNFACISDEFITRSKRVISLNIFVEKHNKNKCLYALGSLKKAMRWDEDVYDLEYDLDTYNIVAVDDFNSGAMENKGLNIFNSKYILACDTETTDRDLKNIESVIAHEYFHNYTGNRVTCRDWFQLSLKEGLTVFRDQCFFADMNDATTARIDDVDNLRSFQFAEDSSNLAHPVRPASYQEIRNFYTSTVYEKGAEVIRMLHTILGHDDFIKGVQNYLKKYDGSAATCDDFIKTFEQTSNINLQQFSLWYSQAGTPHIYISSSYDKEKQQTKITIKQKLLHPKYNYQAMVVPINIALIDKTGENIPINNDKTEEILILNKYSQSFTFNNIKEKPTISFLRNFSAPVITHHDLSYNDRLFLLEHDDDNFNRYEQINQIYKNLVLSFDQNKINKLCLVLNNIIKNKKLNPSFVAKLLYLPTQEQIYQNLTTVDVDLVYERRLKLYRAIATNLKETIKKTYSSIKCDPKKKDLKNMENRELKNALLIFLASQKEHQNLCYNSYNTSANMTDTIAAIRCACLWQHQKTEKILEDFYQKWQNNSLMMDTFFSLQASRTDGDIIQRIKKMQKNPAFDRHNPNKLYNLLGSFAKNTPGFCHKNGEGYKFFAQEIIKIDKFNNQVAARLATCFKSYNKYDKDRQKILKRQFTQMLLEKPSSSLTEIIEKLVAD